MSPIMHRAVSRSIIRYSLPTLRSTTRQRFLSTSSPADKPRSWKSGALRWGLAIGGIYFYNTSNVFAEEPAYFAAGNHDVSTEGSSLPTLESIASSHRSKSPIYSEISSTSSKEGALEPARDTPPPDSAQEPRSPEELEEEAGQQGAFNEETGEINWDCPCLGGMAHGPCGPEFREAFSCFVYSKEEPKGMDCIEKFKGMQECFRAHPDVYPGELESEEDDDYDEEPQNEGAGVPAMVRSGDTSSYNTSTSAAQPENSPEDPAATSAIPPKDSSMPLPPKQEPHKSKKAEERTARAKEATEQVRKDHGGAQSESERTVPKAVKDPNSVKSKGEM